MKPVVIYLIGAPGSGKTTLMNEIVGELGGYGEEFRVCRETFANRINGRDGWVLGKHRAKNGGTDACGKAASGWFRRYIEGGGELPGLILGEGERLGFANFLEMLAEYTDLYVVYLDAGDSREARLEARDGADCAMLGPGGKALATRAANVRDKLLEKGVEVDTVKTGDDGVDYVDLAQMVLGWL